MLKLLVGAGLLFSLTLPGLGQESPYANLADREIKALSSQQIADYLAGRGMGFALPAELNGYPGPRHVLELGDVLELSPDQRERIAAVFDSMQASATELGEAIVEAERELDVEFARGTISREYLDTATERIGRLNGSLRAVHLAAHLETLSLMTPVQVEKYAVHRGYRGGDDSHKMEHSHGK